MIKCWRCGGTVECVIEIHYCDKPWMDFTTESELCFQCLSHLRKIISDFNREMEVKK